MPTRTKKFENDDHRASPVTGQIEDIDLKRIYHSSKLFLTTVVLLWMMGLWADSFGADGLEKPNVGVNYVFFSFMTLSPDFAAAHYTTSEGKNVHL